MITVFTPTYNRGYIISKLYKSLCTQTCFDFEWIVVDDGSSDNTEVLLKSFIEENLINIQYIKQENGGKHRAINRGIKDANGDLFLIVDSDDYLSNTAIESLKFYYNKIKNKTIFSGVFGMRVYPNGKRIGGNVNFDTIECNLLDFRYKYGIHGDLADAYKTKILKKFPFPEIENEKFCPEALVWNRIAAKYKIYFFNENIYICNYLPDGLSANIFSLRKSSPVASMLTYLEFYNSKVPIIIKIKAVLSYWRFYFYSSTPIIRAFKDIGIIGSIFYPFGYLIHIADKIIHK